MTGLPRITGKKKLDNWICVPYSENPRAGQTRGAHDTTVESRRATDTREGWWRTDEQTWRQRRTRALPFFCPNYIATEVSVKKDNLYRIFVYGTLMAGEYNHALIGSQVLEGEGFISGFDLYSLGRYPGIRPSEHCGHTVAGEVYLIDDSTLEQVNILEGEGSLYILQSAEVAMSDGRTVTAGVYVYNHDCPESSRILSGSWKQHS